MNQKGLAPILIVLILAFLVGGYLVYQKQPKPTPSPSAPSTTSYTPQPSPVNETANWKIYTSNKYRFSFKYNPDWKLTEQTNGADVTNNTTTVGLNHYFDISIKVSDNINHKTAEEFINSSNITTASNVSKNPFSGSKKYTNGFINGIIANWSNGDDNLVEVVHATEIKIYEFKLLAGPNTGTLPNEEDQKIFDQILSTFKFLP